METRVCEVSVEVVRVKEEPVWEQDADNEAKAPFISFTEYETPVHIKEEPEDSGSVSLQIHRPELVQRTTTPDDEEKPVVKAEPPSPDGGSSGERAEPHANYAAKEHIEELAVAQTLNVKYEPPADWLVPSDGGKPRDQSDHDESAFVLYLLHAANKGVPPKPGRQRNLRNKHTREKPFTCDICNKSFIWEGLLKRHMLIHSNDVNSQGNSPFHCVVCFKQFTQLLTFTVHLQTHAAEVPYSCDICKKRFPLHSALVKHGLTHRNKPYACEICKELFKRKVELIRHKLSHTCVKPMCGACDNHKGQFHFSTHKRINILRR